MRTVLGDPDKLHVEVSAELDILMIVIPSPNRTYIAFPAVDAPMLIEQLQAAIS